jgi:hypothetical protein
VRREALDYSDYATTAPLFEAFARLPAGHPERADVREELVASHLPLAGDIARKFVRRDEPPAVPGSYDYLCTIHDYMRGTLIVK